MVSVLLESFWCVSVCEYWMWVSGM